MAQKAILYSQLSKASLHFCKMAQTVAVGPWLLQSPSRAPHNLGVGWDAFLFKFLIPSSRTKAHYKLTSNHLITLSITGAYTVTHS